MKTVSSKMIVLLSRTDMVKPIQSWPPPPPRLIPSRGDEDIAVAIAPNVFMWSHYDVDGTIELRPWPPNGSDGLPRMVIYAPMPSVQVP